MMDLNYFFFIILSVLAIASAIVTISTKHPIRSAMALVVHFFMLAGLYLTLNAQFVAVMQILVYAGAIMVLVVFVIMLLNLGKDQSLEKKITINNFGGIIFAGIFGFAIIYAFVNLYPEPTSFPVYNLNFTTVQAIGRSLFTNYIVQFEAIGLLLTAAIIGAVLLAKRKLM